MPSKIYTRLGDQGETGLFDGSRVSKADRRVQALGDMDELVAALGVAKAEITDAGLRELITHRQQELYAAMAAIGAGERRLDLPNPVDAETVRALEGLLDELDAVLPTLTDFVIPGDSRASALCHLARAVCRRAERHVVALDADGRWSIIVTYLNRLSDLLFVLARSIELQAGGADRLMRDS